MDWSWVTEEEDRRMLKGIVALLLSFACLAERACAAPSFVRRLVLAILTRAEAVAREFVTGMAMDRDVPARVPASQAMTAVCPSCELSGGCPFGPDRGDWSYQASASTGGSE